MTTQNALRSFGVGAATGLRSMTGPAFAFADSSGKWNWLFRAAALGEFVGDKLPNTPNRTQPIGLAVRAVAGAIAGAGVAGKNGRVSGAACGLAGALATSYLGVAYRKACLDRKFPAIPAAIAEDLFAMALAWSVTPRKRG